MLLFNGGTKPKQKKNTTKTSELKDAHQKKYINGKGNKGGHAMMKTKTLTMEIVVTTKRFRVPATD